MCIFLKILFFIDLKNLLPLALFIYGYSKWKPLPFHLQSHTCMCIPTAYQATPKSMQRIALQHNFGQQFALCLCFTQVVLFSFGASKCKLLPNCNTIRLSNRLHVYASVCVCVCIGFYMKKTKAFHHLSEKNTNVQKLIKIASLTLNLRFVAHMQPKHTCIHICILHMHIPKHALSSSSFTYMHMLSALVYMRAYKFTTTHTHISTNAIYKITAYVYISLRISRCTHSPFGIFGQVGITTSLENLAHWVKRPINQITSPKICSIPSSHTTTTTYLANIYVYNYSCMCIYKHICVCVYCPSLHALLAPI